jgi:hypothetical protein
LGPYSTYRDRRSTGRELSPARFVPPSGFGYPLDGLLPSYPAPVLFHTGSAHGIRPSEPSPSARYPERFRPSGPTSRLFARFTTPHKAARPARTTAASGLCPVRESLATGALLARRPPAAPLGFSPFKACWLRTLPSVPGFLSRACRVSAKPERAAPQSFAIRRLVRTRAVREARLDQTAFLGFPHLCDPQRLERWSRRAMCSPCAVPDVAIRCRSALWRNPTPC